MTTFAQHLQTGDEIRVIAPASTMAFVGEEVCRAAEKKIKALGFEVTYGKHATEADIDPAQSADARVADLHEAFSDQNVAAILTVIGGYNSNQMLRSIDWNLIRSNPKVFCGYSDITVLQNAMFSQSGLVTYSGPHFSTFGIRDHFEWTLQHFLACVASDEPLVVTPAPTWSDDMWFLNQDERNIRPTDGWWDIQPGRVEGVSLGGNLSTLALLQGTEWMPDLGGAVLFLEDDSDSSAGVFDRQLQSLLHQLGDRRAAGLVVGRFQADSEISRQDLEEVISTKPELTGIPVLGNVDFGHTDPMMTFPVGASVRVTSGPQPSLEWAQH